MRSTVGAVRAGRSSEECCGSSGEWEGQREVLPCVSTQDPEGQLWLRPWALPDECVLGPVLHVFVCCGMRMRLLLRTGPSALPSSTKCAMYGLLASGHTSDALCFPETSLSKSMFCMAPCPPARSMLCSVLEPCSVPCPARRPILHQGWAIHVYAGFTHPLTSMHGAAGLLKCPRILKRFFCV